jgi:hypothetical protein
MRRHQTHDLAMARFPLSGATRTAERRHCRERSVFHQDCGQQAVHVEPLQELAVADISARHLAGEQLAVDHAGTGRQMRHPLPGDVVGVIIPGVFLPRAGIAAHCKGRHDPVGAIPLHQRSHGAAEQIGHAYKRRRPPLEFDGSPIDQRNSGRYFSRGRHSSVVPFARPRLSFRLDRARMQEPGVQSTRAARPVPLRRANGLDHGARRPGASLIRDSSRRMPRCR